jgi:hypothetical protein
MAADGIYLTLASIFVCPRALDIHLPRTRIAKCQVIEFFHVDMKTQSNTSHQDRYQAYQNPSSPKGGLSIVLTRLAIQRKTLLLTLYLSCI